MMHERFRPCATSFALAAILVVATACGDDPTEPGDETVIGVWQATSFNVLGSNLIELGMTVEVDFDADGTYMITVTNDQLGLCPDDEPDCTQDGDYTSSEGSVTLDPGEEDETTFQYAISGSTMTLTGSIEGFPVSASFTRTGG